MAAVVMSYRGRGGARLKGVETIGRKSGHNFHSSAFTTTGGDRDDEHNDSSDAEAASGSGD